MPARARKTLIWMLLIFAPLYAAADKLQDSLDGLSSEDTKVSRDAETYLAKHSQQAVRPLQKILSDGSKSALARFRAAKLLGDLGDKAVVADMQQVLSSGSESNAAVRVEIIRSLVRLGSSSTLIDYLNNKGKDEAPSVKAAIAIGLQDNKDEESKKALSGLLADKDRRVFQAAFTAVCKIYQPATSADKNCPSSPATPPAQTGGTPQKTPRLIQPEIVEPSDRVSPTPGDQAIFRALQSTQSNGDAEISPAAGQLLTALSEHYKQQ